MLRAQAVSRLTAHRQSFLICRRYSSALEGADRTVGRENVNSDDGPNSVLVRTWNNPRSSIDCLAIVQYLERAFGPVDEYRLNRYGDRMSNRMLIRFRENASAARACEYSRTFQIPAPPPLTHSPLEGGMSLEELTSVLDAKPLEPGLEPTQVDTDGQEQKPNNERPALLSFQVLKYKSVYHFIPLEEKPRGLSAPARASFVRWGGFADIKPLPEGTSVDKMDHRNMRMSISAHAKAVGMKSPLSLKKDRSASADVDSSKSRGLSNAESSSSSESTASVSLPNVSQLSSESTDVNWEPIDFSQGTSNTESATPIPTSSESSPPEPTIQIPATASQKTSAPTPAVPTPPSKLSSRANTPEASAQLKAASGILRQLNQKQQKTKAPTAPAPKPEKRTKANTKQSRQTSFLETEAVPPSSAHTSSTQIQTNSTDGQLAGSSAPKTKAEGVTSRIKSFVGSWF